MASAKGPFGREDLDGNLAGRDGSAVPDEDVMQGVEHRKRIVVTSIVDILIIMGGMIVLIVAVIIIAMTLVIALISPPRVGGRRPTQTRSIVGRRRAGCI